MVTRKKVVADDDKTVARTSKRTVRYNGDNKQAVPDKSDSASSLERLRSVIDQRARNKQQSDAEEEQKKKDKPPLVSLGPSGAIVDALINTAPNKMLELTDFDRVQVALVPQVVVIDDMWDYMEHVLEYRDDHIHYHGVHGQRYPDMVDTSRQFVLTLAQARRSLGGRMKKALEDMALAELDNRAGEDTDIREHDDFRD